MTTEQPADLEYAQLLDALPDAVYWMRALRDAEGQVLDFQVDYVNRKAQEITQGVYQVQVGTTVLGTNQHDRPAMERSFGELCEVLVTGRKQERTHFNPTLKGWFLSHRTRLGDGVLSVIRDVTNLKAVEQNSDSQARLLSGILDASQDAIRVLEAIRDDNGVITDFRSTHVNRTAARLLGYSVPELLHSSFLALYPGLKQTGLFDAYCRVVETGQPYQNEVFYNHDGLDTWFDVSAVKLGDGFALTFKDIGDRKRVALRSEQQADENRRQAGLMQTMLDGALNGVLLLEPVYDPDQGTVVDFKILAANRAVERLTGADPAQAVGRTMQTVYPGYRQGGFFSLYCDVLTSGEPQVKEFYYQDETLTGWFEVSVVKQGDGLVLTFASTTHARQAQLAVEQAAADNRRQAELVNSVLDSSPSGIMSFEAVRDGRGTIVDFRFVTVNQASEQITGLPVDALIGNALLTVFPGNADSGLFAMYVRTTETGEPTYTETYYNYDGLDFWLDISARKLGDGFVVTFSDISLIKRAARVVEQSALQLQTVIDTAQTGIFLFSPVRDEPGDVVDFRFRLANRQLAAYVGQTPEAVNGALGSTWFPDYKTNGLFDAYRKTYLTGESQRFDFHYDGSGIDAWLDIMSTKMGDDVVVTFGDYTPLKRLQQQLEASVVDLQRSNRNLEQFAYVASHDLQEPLRKIQAFGDIIQTRYAPVIGPEGADMIGRMHSAAARMQVLIRDVLAYSRIATMRDVTTPVDLNQLVEGVLTDLERAIGDKQASVRVSALPTVNGDALQLRQLFQNLIGNALKFNRPGQPVVVMVSSRSVRGGDLPNVPVSPGDANRLFHQIDVADTGIGFEPHHAERIFQVFQRLHGRSNYEGTGIGLAIVLKVVQNHQGYIVAEGRPGEGAVFQIFLPA